MKMKYLFLFTFIAFSLTSCIKDEVDKTVRAYTPEEFEVLSQNLDLPIEALDYTLELPEHLGLLRVASNKHQATLGRVLFYDKKLSVNESVSCATCHEAEKAFADGKAQSEGFDEELTKRNSLALGAFPSFNAYYGFGGTRMFWDERASTVTEQSRLTISDPIEMGHPNLAQLANELLEHDYYRILFDKAYPEDQFGSNLTSDEKMLQALDAFVSSIGSFATKFDDGWAAHNSDKVTYNNFTQEENLGKNLFNDNCASCHNLGPGFATAVTSANNGLDMVYEDEGMYEFNNQTQSKGVFKVPMLRNIALTGPYMHDGRFETLEDVVDHYSSGVAEHENLHQNLRNFDGSPKQMNFNQEQKDALIAFLHTLTDKESLAQERYADPFKK